MPLFIGLNHDVIYGAQPYGLPLGERLLPQHLGQLGYISHLVGKWHLGMAIKEMTPNYRGFASHFGYWTGHKDYYDHSAQEAVGMSIVFSCVRGSDCPFLWWF